MVGSCLVSSRTGYIRISVPTSLNLTPSSTVCHSTYDIYVSMSVCIITFSKLPKDLLGCKLALPPSALNPVSWESVSPLINPPLSHLTFCPLIQHIQVVHLGWVMQQLQDTIAFFLGQAQLFLGWIILQLELSYQLTARREGGGCSL